MGIKRMSDKTYTVSYSKRHKTLNTPVSMHRIKIPNRAQAERVYRELVEKVHQKVHAKVVPSWSRLVNEHFQSKRLSDEWTQKTCENARLCLEAHTFADWADRPVDSITTTDIKHLVDRQTGHRSVGTQQSLLKFIRGAFQYANDCAYLRGNPVPNIRYRNKEKIAKVLTEEQVRVLLERAKVHQSPWYYHWALALYTGMRNGELFALTWDNVNFESRTILVDCSWNKMDGFKETKSGDDRIVEIAPNLVVILKELKLAQFDSHFVLARSRNWEKGEQARMLRMFLEGIGLPPVRFHDLRATWATIMLNKGVEPIKVMSMGGWKQLKTMQIYIRKAGVNIRGITDKLDLHNPSRQDAKVLEMTVSES